MTLDSNTKTRKCSTCQKVKKITDFSKASRGIRRDKELYALGRRHKCRSCVAKYFKKYRLKNLLKLRANYFNRKLKNLKTQSKAKEKA